MKLRTAVYTGFMAMVFLTQCLITVPTFIILGQRKSWHHLALRLHHFWSRSFFWIGGIKVEITGKENMLRDQQQIFCCNHFSYMDIPGFLLLTGPKFIGKSSISKVPLFGYFYRKIHITVDRANIRSRAQSLINIKNALMEGFNVTFFPEGGVRVKPEDLPYMVPFKDGAFRLAMETKRPIVPVTMPYNFLILPDKKPLRLHNHACKIIVHDPIYPTDEDTVKTLKDKTFDVIQAELLKHHPDKVKVVG